MNSEWLVVRILSPRKTRIPCVGKSGDHNGAGWLYCRRRKRCRRPEGFTLLEELKSLMKVGELWAQSTMGASRLVSLPWSKRVVNARNKDKSISRIKERGEKVKYSWQHE